RPTFGRGVGSVGRGAGLMSRTFDARQKIGTTDVRQRLGGSGGLSFSCVASSPAFQVKDAREKIGQKDARFRIQARGGAASTVQDARQTINSRKQQQGQDSPSVSTSQTPIPHIHIQNSSSSGIRVFPTNHTLGTRVGVAIQPRGGITKVVDARDRLSLKRSISSLPSQGSALPLKITKTIQSECEWMCLSVQSVSTEEEEELPNKQLKFTTTNDLSQTRVGGGGFSVSPPITKVVKNDTYLAPPPPASATAAAVAPTRSQLRPPAQTPDNPTPQPAQVTHSHTHTHTHTHLIILPHNLHSPLEGTKITVNNLHPRVTEEDIVELFCVCGALKRARLVKVGVAEVVFVRKDDAISAYRKYNNRCLDGQPMKCNLHIQGSVITSEQPILLRLSDSPGKKETPSSAVSRSTPRSSSAEVDPQTILKALFKSSNQSSATTETPPSAAHSTAFRIKI
ncbi:polymerase delta-interacting protein 3 isoform X1, partial [Silurus asotus]